MQTTDWVWIAALVVAAVYAITVYNHLIRLRNAMANAFAQIDVQLKRRYDLVPNLVEVARKYLQHERETLEAVIAARNHARTAATQASAHPELAAGMLALGSAEGVLGGALGRLMAVAEAYPELKADQTMRELSEELNSTENRIGFARQAFNDAVLAFNDRVGQFPANLVARVLGFAQAAMLESTESPEERKAPRVQF
jgi:LemA protein